LFPFFTNYNETMLFCADLLLGDFLVAENAPLQSENSERGSPFPSPRHNLKTPSLDGGPETPSSGGSGYAICCFFL
jgi:hypothetical protein